MRGEPGPLLNVQVSNTLRTCVSYSLGFAAMGLPARDGTAQLHAL